tara:strand:+ start:234 stop:458 length:225 start_codon:yes stop_codon:yes gene_type:complete
MNKEKEGNIISFKVLIDAKGFLMTEYSQLPSNKVREIFNANDSRIIRKVLSELEPKLQVLHTKLEEELSALNHK